jgi:anaerobic magnesium-protoporphyrin IX monomethyl ester cyclase
MKQLRTVLLITPPYHCGMVESAGVWMPLGLAYLAGSLRANGFEPLIYDAMSRFESIDDIASRIRREQPDVVATTAFTATLPAALDLLRAAKREVPGVVTVIGGVHPTHMAASVLGDPAVDYVVRGEGEYAFPELLACLNAGDSPGRVAGISYRTAEGVVDTPSRALIRDLDALPIDWDALEWPLYHYRTKPGSVLAISSWARGYTMSCRFCSQQKMWRRTWRPRSEESIIAELKLLKSRFGVDTLEIADEYPTCDRRRWEHVLDRLIAEDLGIELLAETRADDVVRDREIIGKYREAGILHMYVGVESPLQEQLDWIDKSLLVSESKLAIELLNKAGIITETSFLLGYPSDTRETVEEALRLAKEYSPDLAFFLAITPWPYADMYDDVADRVEVFDYSKYNLINPIIRPEGMTRDELAKRLSQAFGEFYREKMRNLSQMPAHKREYMVRVAKLLMEDSYLAHETSTSLAELGMPAHALAGATGHPAGVPMAGAGHPNGGAMIPHPPVTDGVTARVAVGASSGR